MYPMMESHPYALQMQREMAQQIQTAKPRFLIYVDLFTSLGVGPTSEKYIFDWLDRYLREHYHLVGAAALITINHTAYCWDEDVEKCLSSSPFSIAVLQRTE